MAFPDLLIISNTMNKFNFLFHNYVKKILSGEFISTPSFVNKTNKFFSNAEMEEEKEDWFNCVLSSFQESVLH